MINYLEFFIIFMPFYDKSPDRLLLIAHWAFTTDLPLG